MNRTRNMNRTKNLTYIVLPLNDPEMTLTLVSGFLIMVCSGPTTYGQKGQNEMTPSLKFSSSQNASRLCSH